MGIVPLERALQLAADVDLDLVEVAPMARPPVCKLMDFGKFKYESALKAREARRNQQQTVIKEMKLRPKIDPHDYETKKGHVLRFLKAGDKVKVTIMFRGREQSRPELGFRLLRRLEDEIQELGYVEASAKQDGRNMIMVIAPHKSSKAARTGGLATASRRTSARTWRASRMSVTRPNRARPRARREQPDASRAGSGPETQSTCGPSAPALKPRAGAVRRPALEGPEHDAEDQTPHRHGQAGQGDRHRQAPHRAGRASATCWRSSSPPHPPPDGHGRDVQRGPQAGEEAAGPLTRATQFGLKRGDDNVARVKRAVNAQKKRRTVLEGASGYRGQRSRLYRKAKEQMLHSMQYAYRDRRDRKGDFRQLWITRINAAARANGMTYNRLIQGLRLAGIEVDRKILADLAVNDATTFAGLVEAARAALPANRGRGLSRLTPCDCPDPGPTLHAAVAPGRRCSASCCAGATATSRACSWPRVRRRSGRRWPPARSTELFGTVDGYGRSRELVEAANAADIPVWPVTEPALAGAGRDGHPAGRGRGLPAPAP